MRTQSNSKLTAEQKSWVTTVTQASYWAEKVQFFSYPGEGVTVAIIPDGGDWFNIGMSFCSKDEKYFRPEVGQYHALLRHDNGTVLRVPYDAESEPLEYLADALVQALIMPYIIRESKVPKLAKDKKPKATAEHADYKTYPAYKKLRSLVKAKDADRWPEIKNSLKKAFLSEYTRDIDPDAQRFSEVFVWSSTPQEREYWEDISCYFD